MRLKIAGFAFVLLSILVMQTGCKKEKGPAPFISADCPDTIFYQSQIKPMMDQNCSTSGCHDASGQAGVVLLNHTQVSDRSAKILKTIRYESGVAAMPQGAPKLADSLIQQFVCWINQGKQNN